MTGEKRKNTHSIEPAKPVIAKAKSKENSKLTAKKSAKIETKRGKNFLEL